MIMHRQSPISFTGAILLTVLSLMAPGCKPDETPALKAETETLRKQAAKQESVIVSLQEGNKVMQQQIDLLNWELREAKKETDRAVAERKALAEKLEAERKVLAGKLETQVAENKKLTAEAQRMAAKKVQASQGLRAEDKGGQTEELPRPLPAVAKAAEEALARNGYAVKVSAKTDQKTVYVTERKVSTPASLEVPGFRNQYLVSLQALPSNGTKLTVKAEFEKVAQGGRILAVSPDESAEIERRLIAEIGKALAAPSKL
jgi:hypothetical protein